MGAAAAASPHVPIVTRALRAVGLGGVTHLSNAVLQPLLIALLLVSVGTALWRAQIARSTPAVTLAVLTVGAAAGLYASIYITYSEAGYWITLSTLILASLLSARAGRRGKLLRAA
jgi:hypothetical protein